MPDLSQNGGGSAPPCPGPDPVPHGPSRFTVPAGAVDTHAHVIGLPPDYPLVENRSYTPPAALAPAYLGMLDCTGMAYGVLVQVSVHGTDNRLMVETPRANRDRPRGIAVVPSGSLTGDVRSILTLTICTVIRRAERNQEARKGKGKLPTDRPTVRPCLLNRGKSRRDLVAGGLGFEPRLTESEALPHN
jgi:Amidohydrolase